MKYLRLFANEASFEAAKTGIPTPGVAYAVSEDKVHYLPNTTI